MNTTTNEWIEFNRNHGNLVDLMENVRSRTGKTRTTTNEKKKE